MLKNYFKYILFVLVVSISIGAKVIYKPSQNNSITECHTSGVVEMQGLVSDKGFQDLHPVPVAVSFVQIGKMVSFEAKDGKNASGYAIAAKNKSDKWLFVYQEWWGLNDHIKHEADKLYKDLGENVNVLALDMYDGQATTVPQEAGKLMQSTPKERLMAIISAGYAYAGADAKVASIGWCFGGSLSLESALVGGQQNLGSVIYYGMPVRDVERLKTLNSDVLGIFATEERISKTIIEEFAAKMKEANKNLTYEIYPGVHGFANPSNPKYDAGLTAQVYEKALGYLKAKFGV
ncbi:MAG: dienelactone hydrolase family protein [Leadbetterella sp.]